MADKDDDANPFDEGPWVDRDDEAPPTPGGVPRGAPASSSDDDDGSSVPASPEQNADWRDRVVDEPDLEDAAPLVDLDDDREAPWEPSAAPAPAREKPTDRDSSFEGGFVDRDSPEDDDLNAAAERELFALGDDRFPLDDDDGDDAEAEGGRATSGARDAGDTGDEDSRAAGAVDRDPGSLAPLVDSDEDGLAAPWAARGSAPGAAEDRGRRLPLTLMAVAALAVILLAVGGYGVLSERAALRDRIEELQARLATAGAEPGPAEPGPAEPGPAEPDPAAAAALARLGDLENELGALAQENSALRARIADLRGRLDSTGGDTAADGDTGGPAQQGESLAADAPTAVETAKSATTAAASEARPADSGGDGATWFVNFSSYTEPATARRRAAELSVDAGRVVVQDAVSGGRTVYRVRVVGIESRSAADAVASRLAAAYSLPRLWVGRD